MLARGGMGVVFLARDTRLGRRVAVKFLHRDAPTMTERFLVEARATARCHHENIVVIHEVGVHQDMPFLVLEYLDGAPLSTLLKNGAMRPRRAVELIVPVVRALECAHQHNIVHRDLKPDNIMVTRSGLVKVLDFGIAKILGATRDVGGSCDTPAEAGDAVSADAFTDLAPVALTAQGRWIGTAPYMSPEQWLPSPGSSARDRHARRPGGQIIDQRSDLWALGAILYQMVIGRHPLADIDASDLERVVTSLDVPMPSACDAGRALPLPLARAIDRCLTKSRDARMPSARALLDQLLTVLPGRAGRDLETGECPYPGLTPFQGPDANRFFGRSREISAALAMLVDQPLLAITGPSGVGKSSFVRAGVIPALEHSGERWDAVIIRPGRRPMAALADLVSHMRGSATDDVSDKIARHQETLDRLHDEPGYLGVVLRQHARDHRCKRVLFIDQFEELYTLTSDSGDRKAFTACLAGLADDPSTPLRVVLSLRSDFLDRISEDPRFLGEVNAGLFFLTPPDRDGLRDALTEPAEMAHYRFETRAMVENMLDVLEATPGSLPLLQFAATKLWEGRDQQERVLTAKSYAKIGGITGALRCHADAVLDTLEPADQALVRAIFLRLVTPDRTRAIETLEDLCELSSEPDEVKRLVAHLVDARLLISDRDGSEGTQIEIVHESLIVSWPTLTRWLDEHQEDAAYIEQIAAAAGQWEARQDDPGLLWRGEAAEDARRWRRRYHDRLRPAQERFLQATFALADRRRRIRRWSVIGVLGFLSLLLAAASVALVLIRDAEQEAQERKEEAIAAAEEARRSEERAEASRALAERNREKAESNHRRAEQESREKHRALLALEEKVELVRMLLSELAEKDEKLARSKTFRHALTLLRPSDKKLGSERQASVPVPTALATPDKEDSHRYKPLIVKLRSELRDLEEARHASQVDLEAAVERETICHKEVSRLKQEAKSFRERARQWDEIESKDPFPIRKKD